MFGNFFYNCLVDERFFFLSDKHDWWVVLLLLACPLHKIPCPLSKVKVPVHCIVCRRSICSIAMYLLPTWCASANNVIVKKSELQYNFFIQIHVLSYSYFHVTRLKKELMPLHAARVKINYRNLGNLPFLINKYDLGSLKGIPAIIIHTLSFTRNNPCVCLFQRLDVIAHDPIINIPWSQTLFHPIYTKAPAPSRCSGLKLVAIISLLVSTDHGSYLDYLTGKVKLI